ncbi:helix-turn-helix domain-containing protein [Mycolicibacterium smegmatis]|uniref:IclR family transcriptional regulator n=1 Tax=Mycolicibacterium smegmatis TaxID=1772 RepID=UPI0005662439|nr:helix-turn-helix domain-containing protein [Mycolicibacterium smegmatis]MCP2625603.1 helix-turn-helix domain-containing protein [Mycolicibacterium smegmatis]MCP2626372.1 helix-turn-helix domain-containing protein [Mycolicibacterium smegmatis]MDF1897783.1 helix-turn-helix domain-containing protein [Mycolicibacterium smegmatis]MDF1904339.1 helix-turn-helix domain-containing protein [Mycolicibacterium smegmatis]MDF1917686.1 helix-turn-helix domain-containing protein [Mycolicibacterium smegmati
MATNDSGAENSPRAAAVKVLDVLAALSERGGCHRIVDLAARTELPKATVYRLLQHLVSQGFVVAEPDSTYRIGPRFLGIAAAALSDAPWRKTVAAALESLRTATGLSAHFAQQYGGNLVIVDAVESLDPFAIPVRPGLTTAIEQTALGQAIVSTSSEAVVSQDPARQLRWVAAPVFHRRGEVLGALGVAGTDFTLADQALDRVRAVVRSAAADASAVLTAPSFGHRGTA